MKVGLIGCGGIASAHVGVYKKMKDVDIVGLCDLNLERARDLAAKFRVEKTYQNYWDMFEKEKPDMVDICTPVSTHSKIVCDTAELVPAILVEKPMGLNVSQCDEMIRKVEKHGRKLCIGHSQIFSPNIRKATEIVNSENFNLHSFSTVQKESFEILKTRDLAPPWNVLPDQRGIIWEVCCHLAYLQLHFLPDIQEVYAVGSKVKYPVYDDFAVLLRTSREAFGMIELSWVSRETECIYELRNTTGRRLQIHWEFDYMLENAQEPPFTSSLVAKNILVDQKRLIQKWTRFFSSYFKKRKLLPIFTLVSEFVESIQEDKQPPVTPQDGRNTVNLLECIEKSLSERRPIVLQ
ncbi:Gfo/Idh/MocA family oxidoreductase [Candidatus Bathyarchaeota archaeon]|nr:Gfo/Idh/MocA family oxidoreductase [Candidatus Bathyarchaeota archaeon]